MTKQMFKISAILTLFIMLNAQSVVAQSFLKKLTKTAESVTSTLSSTTGSESESDTAKVKPLKWDKVPKYSIQKLTSTDSDGTPLLNEDGTPIVKYFLVDQDGPKRTPEAIKEQHQKLNKAVTNILLKVGGGAAVGVAGGLLASKGKAKGGIIGGVAGAAAGLALSAKDIKAAKALKADLKEQENLVAAYEKTFTTEGTPIDASVDLSNVDGIDFTKGESVSLTADALKKELDDPQYTSSPSPWEL